MGTKNSRRSPELRFFGLGQPFQHSNSDRDFIAEHTEFTCIDDYYAAYDLRGDTLAGVHATILAAEDDPIIPPEHYRELPKSLDIELTGKGGHTAYIKNWQLDSWVDDTPKRF